MQREQADQLDRGAQRLAEQLLDVLDAFDQAVQHGVTGLTPLVIRRSRWLWRCAACERN